MFWPNGLNAKSTLMGAFLLWVQGPDLNRRPPGYEPDELPDCSTLRYLILNTIGAGDRNRTGTKFNPRRILSPVRLPVPPLRRTYRALL